MKSLQENKLILSVVILIVFILIYSFTRTTETRITNIGLKESGPIVVFGDSLASGVGSREIKGGFATRLSQRLNVEIVNKGVSGNTTADGLKRIESDVLNLNPKIVIISLGGNDYLRKVPQDQTEENLNEIIRKVHEKQATVILLGIKTGIISDDSKKMFERIVAKHRPAYVPNLLGGILLKADLMSDAIHPNDKGYDKVADKIEPVLVQLLR